VGVAWIVQRSGVVELGAKTLLSSLLIALGVGMVFTARRAGGFGLVCVGIVLTVILAASSSSIDVGNFATGVGDRTERPRNASTLRPEYHLGAGHLNLNLSDLPITELSDGVTPVKVEMTFGQLTLTLPTDAGVGVQVIATIRAGEFKVDGQATQHGNGLKETFRTEGFDAAAKKIDISVDVSGGSVEIKRARG
jgi:hypothetical protein